MIPDVKREEREEGELEGSVDLISERNSELQLSDNLPNQEPCDNPFLAAFQQPSDHELSTVATELWLSNNHYSSVKRRRVHSDPTPRLGQMAGTGLMFPIQWDELPDLVGIVPSWTSDQGSVVGGPPPLVPIADRFSVSSGGVSAPPPSVYSEDGILPHVPIPCRTVYTDETLDGIFRGIMDNMGAYQDEYERLHDTVARLDEESRDIQVGRFKADKYTKIST